MITTTERNTHEGLNIQASQEQVLLSVGRTMSNLFCNIVKSLERPSFDKVDIEDILTIINSPGKTTIRFASAEGPNRSITVVDKVVANFGGKAWDTSGIQGYLLLVTAATGRLKLSESQVIRKAFYSFMPPSTFAIYGSSYDDALGEKVRLTVITNASANCTSYDIQPLRQC